MNDPFHRLIEDVHDDGQVFGEAAGLVVVARHLDLHLRLTQRVGLAHGLGALELRRAGVETPPAFMRHTHGDVAGVRRGVLVKVLEGHEREQELLLAVHRDGERPDDGLDLRHRDPVGVQRLFMDPADGRDLLGE